MGKATHSRRNGNPTSADIRIGACLLERGATPVEAALGVSLYGRGLAPLDGTALGAGLAHAVKQARLHLGSAVEYADGEADGD